MQNNQSRTANGGENKSLKPVSIILSLIVLLALGNYLNNNRHIFTSLKNINTSFFLILTLIYFAFVLTLGYLNKIMIQKLEPNIKTKEIIGLQFINNFLNKILPKGGVAFRAMYFKQQHNLSYSFFLASFSGLVIVNIASLALVSLGAIFFIFLQTGLYNTIIIFGFVVIFLVQ